MIFGKILAAIGLRGLLVILTLCAFLGYHVYAVREATEAGRTEIRIAWAEANRKAEIQAIARQQKQQEAISAADAELDRQRAEAAAHASDLENALAAERAANDNASTPACVPPPMSERLRKSLNDIR